MLPGAPLLFRVQYVSCECLPSSLQPLDQHAQSDDSPLSSPVDLRVGIVGAGMKVQLLIVR